MTDLETLILPTGQGFKARMKLCNFTESLSQQIPAISGLILGARLA